MLARNFRLKSAYNFTSVKQDGKRWRASLLTVGILPNGLEHNRFGIVTSKRVGNAVARNRVKRRIRAILHHTLPYMHPGYDMVWVANPSTGSASYQEIESTIHDLLRKSKCWKLS